MAPVDGTDQAITDGRAGRGTLPPAPAHRPDPLRRIAVPHGRPPPSIYKETSTAAAARRHRPGLRGGGARGNSPTGGNDQPGSN
ncbi:hypothetical protein GCM10010124_11140 [Pilimelia terevasa]|uniref:Uncharacterized protein n=1 Tax=Pilimelia terevasa TaxID=53372 RepID=A0A8J3BLS8_9ACTN|nr:hypothetical protein GCM10010124_11140 [Pilimelia terevasa]